jgi:hypothetical protein
LDNKTVIDLIEPSIDYDISEIVVGSGFSKSRHFDGELSKFEIKYTFFKKNKKILSFLAALKNVSILLEIVLENPVLWTGMKGVSAKGRENLIRC